MRFDFYYRREHVVDIDAAVVGVSRLRWSSLSAEEADDLERARLIMQQRQFDIMPIDGGDHVAGYVRTASWGDFTEVERHELKPGDVISQHLPLEEVIRGFTEEERLYYFLASYGRITGLITVVNLNCRQAKVYLYALINELEVSLGAFMRRCLNDGALNEEQVLSEVRPGTRKRFEKDRKAGVEADLVEYLYLPELLDVLGKHQLLQSLGLSDDHGSENPMGDIVVLRNRVAHPVRSLVEKPADIERLWRDVSVLEEALDRLAIVERTAASVST